MPLLDGSAKRKIEKKKSYGGGTGFVLADSGIQVGTLNSKLLREERKSRTTRSGSLPAHVRRELPSMTKQEYNIHPCLTRTVPFCCLFGVHFLGTRYEFSSVQRMCYFHNKERDRARVHGLNQLKGSWTGGRRDGI